MESKRSFGEVAGTPLSSQVQNSHGTAGYATAQGASARGSSLFLQPLQSITLFVPCL